MVGLCERSPGLGWMIELGVKWGLGLLLVFVFSLRVFFLVLRFPPTKKRRLKLQSNLETLNENLFLFLYFCILSSVNFQFLLPFIKFLSYKFLWRKYCFIDFLPTQTNKK